ncbi:hypothetical protein [Clostridium porci]|uniref:Uncharacterized protein n=1 Tax=Clostridium porci TaxID=2605778 RepID=A0A7X2TCH8_9CLOT|nr:hypothetical protein [Clostridium porci]MSS36565.1 hypothetical protein [Clostridium porci]
MEHTDQEHLLINHSKEMLDRAITETFRISATISKGKGCLEPPISDEPFHFVPMRESVDKAMLISRDKHIVKIPKHCVKVCR